MNDRFLARYREGLSLIFEPGRGNGYHNYIMGLANLGILACLSPGQIFDDIRRHTPIGGRRVGNKEIWETIIKAAREIGNSTFTPEPQPRPALQHGEKVRQAIINEGKFDCEVDIWEKSPVRLQYEPARDMTLFLQIMYEPTEYVFIADHDVSGIPGSTIRNADSWTDHFQRGGRTAPFIIVNPLTGQPAPKKDGNGETYRGDNCVRAFKFMMVEFDNLSKEDQYRFWSGVHLPLRALVDTGGKSVHAWIDIREFAPVDIVTLENWIQVIEKFYRQYLEPLGVDRACKNAARLSRLPGHYRKENQAYQRLIWLSANGRTI